jgi:hypothetical protein
MRLLLKVGCGKYTFGDRHISDPRHRLLATIEPDRYTLSRSLGYLRMFQLERISDQNQQ